MEKMLDYFFYYMDSQPIYSVFYLKAGVIGFLMIFINIAVAIAAVTLIVTYTHVHKFLKAQPRKRKEMTRTIITASTMVKVKRKFQQAKFTRIYLWVLVVFLICYFPAAIVVYILPVLLEMRL